MSSNSSTEPDIFSDGMTNPNQSKKYLLQYKYINGNNTVTVEQ